jgi:hypothetical protein
MTTAARLVASVADLRGLGRGRGGRRAAWPLLAGALLMSVWSAPPGEAYDVYVSGHVDALRCLAGHDVVKGNPPFGHLSEVDASVTATDSVNDFDCQQRNNGASAGGTANGPDAKITASASAYGGASQTEKVHPLAVVLAGFTETFLFSDPSTARPPGQRHAFLRIEVSDANFPSGALDCGIVDELPPLPDSPCEETAITVSTSQNQYYDAHAAPILPFKASRTIGSSGPAATYYVRVPMPDNEPFVSELLNVELQSQVRRSGHTQATARLWAEKPNDVSMQLAVPGPQPRFMLGVNSVLQSGQAVPAPPGGSLTISPPSGTLVPGQAFDLALIVQSEGQPITGVAASLDGVDVGAALGGCVAAHAGALTGGTPGAVLRCPGLVADLFGGPGNHTLAVTVTLGDGRTLSDTAVYQIPAASTTPASPSLLVSPAPGAYAASQSFDLVIVLDAAGRAITGAQVTFDEADVTSIVAGCAVAGTLPTGQLTFRCPGLPADALGLGTHLFRVTVTLSDGSTVADGAVWQILAATGA